MSDKLVLTIYPGLPLIRKFRLRRDGAYLDVAGYAAELHIQPPGLSEIACDQANNKLTLDVSAGEWTLTIPGAETAGYSWRKAPLYLLFVQPNGVPLAPATGWAVVHELT